MDIYISFFNILDLQMYNFYYILSINFYKYIELKVTFAFLGYPRRGHSFVRVFV